MPIVLLPMLFLTPLFFVLLVYKNSYKHKRNTGYHTSYPRDLKYLPLIKPSLLTKELHLYNSISINFLPHTDTRVIGGHTLIVLHLIDPTSSWDVKSLQYKRNIFLDQVSSVDGLILFGNMEIYQELTSNKFKGRTPN